MRVRACDMRDARVYACYVYGAGVYICTYTCVRVCICALARMCVHACVFMGLYLARNPQLCDTSSRPDGGRTSSGGPTSKRPSPPSARRVRRGRRRDTPCARFRPHPTARSATDCDRRDAARALPFPPLPPCPRTRRPPPALLDPPHPTRRAASAPTLSPRATSFAIAGPLSPRLPRVPVAVAVAAARMRRSTLVNERHKSRPPRVIVAHRPHVARSCTFSARVLSKD